MRIISVAAQTVRWPIAGRGAARGRTERAAVLLEVQSDRGATGLGEAAPLPGLSLDTLEDAELALAAFAGLAPFDVLVRDPATAPAPCLPFEIADRAAARAFAAAPPAARFAIETALLDALARERRTSLAALLGGSMHRGRSAAAASTAPAVPRAHVGADPSPRAGTASTPTRNAPAPAHVGADPSPRAGTGSTHVGALPSVPLAAVVDDPETAHRAFAAGIRCFKIKLGAEDRLDRVLAIAAAVPGARLRIDANRSWPRDEAHARLAQLAELPIDYVEEPCRDAHRLLSSALPCQLALDESLAEISRDDLLAALRTGRLAALILKPTLLGGLSAALELAALARRFGVAAIASHALEGPIGTAACAELALALGGDHPAGLAPHAALAGWSIAVAQLTADRVQPATAPGLGFGDLDLATAVRACRS